jgi:hypothetical protein
MEIHPMPPGFIIVTFICLLSMVILCALWKWAHDQQKKQMWRSAMIVEGPVTKAQAEAAGISTTAVQVHALKQSVEAETTKEAVHAAM